MGIEKRSGRETTFTFGMALINSPLFTLHVVTKCFKHQYLHTHTQATHTDAQTQHLHTNVVLCDTVYYFKVCIAVLRFFSLTLDNINRTICSHLSNSSGVFCVFLHKIELQIGERGASRQKPCSTVKCKLDLSL